MTERPRRLHSLASRLVVVGVVQLILLAITAVVIFIAEGPHEQARPEDHITSSLIQRLEAVADDQPALEQLLATLRTRRIEASVYDAQRLLVASNVDPPLAIPERRGRRPVPEAGGTSTPPPRMEDPTPDAPPPRDAHSTPDVPPTRAKHATADPPTTSTPTTTPAGSTPTTDTTNTAALPANATPDVATPPTIAGPDVPTERRRLPPDLAPRTPGGGAGMRGRPHRARLVLDDGPRPHRMLLRVQVHGGPGFLVARGVHGEPPGLTGPLLVLSCGFAILVLGALITARWILRPIEQLTRTARALGSGDLSARSKLGRSDEIGELGVRVDEMADRIEALLATEKELLANVAHELRTPLARIGVALDLAGEGDAEAARVALSEIAVDVSELEAIVDDILTAMRAEVAGTLPLRKAVVEPKDIAAASESRMRSRHPGRTLHVRVADGLPAIDADPVLFRRVIDNLLENAHKYSPDPDAAIELTATRVGERVELAVADRGIGISAEDLPRVFAPFFRGDRSRSRETGGVGLGLTLAKRIVEAHRGTIDVTSEPGAGTTVRVTVPALA